MRIAKVVRKTRETQISLELNLDGCGKAEVDSGIGFLDHMLYSFAVHGIFDLTLKAEGDLHVDAHHTVEDIALALGSAFDQSLSDRQGIVRIADCYVPMDETLAQAVVDLSGRPYAVIEAAWNNSTVGGIPTSLFPHFFESFSVTARCNLHARVIYGRDDHHRAEALFKALARSLERAARIEPRRAGSIPSTKGTLTA